MRSRASRPRGPPAAVRDRRVRSACAYKQASRMRSPNGLPGPAGTDGTRLHAAAPTRYYRVHQCRRRWRRRVHHRYAGDGRGEVQMRKHLGWRVRVAVAMRRCGRRPDDRRDRRAWRKDHGKAHAAAALEVRSRERQEGDGHADHARRDQRSSSPAPTSPTSRTWRTRTSSASTPTAGIYGHPIEYRTCSPTRPVPTQRRARTPSS